MEGTYNGFNAPTIYDQGMEETVEHVVDISENHTNPNNSAPLEDQPLMTAMVDSQILSNEEEPQLIPERRANIQELSVDEITLILGFVDRNANLAIGSSCKRFYNISSDNKFWKLYLAQEQKQVQVDESRKRFKILDVLHIAKPVTEEPATEGETDELVSSNVKYKKKYSNYRKHKLLHSRYQKLVHTRDKHHILYNWDIYRAYFWYTLLIMLAIVVPIDTIILPLYLDSIIPQTGLFWLIPFLPLAFIASCFLLLLFADSKLIGFFPVPIKSQTVGETEGDIVITFASNFIWMGYVFIAIVLKLAITPSLPTWRYFMIPTYFLMFFQFMSSIPIMKNMYSESRERADNTIILTFVLGLGVILLFIGVGILLCTLRADGVIALSWSVIFILFHLVFVVLMVCVFLNIFLQCWYSNELVWMKVGAMVILLTVSGTVMLTILLCGLRMDGFKNISFIAAFIPIYGFYAIALSCLLLVCCIYCYLALFC